MTQAAQAGPEHPRRVVALDFQSRRIVAEIAATGKEQKSGSPLEHERSARSRVTEPKGAGVVPAIARGAQVQCQVFDGRQLAGLAEAGPLPIFRFAFLALKDDCASVREGTHAARTGLGNHQQPVGGNELDPAAGTLGTEVLGAEIPVQIV